LGGELGENASGGKSGLSRILLEKKKDGGEGTKLRKEKLLGIKGA